MAFTCRPDWRTRLKGHAQGLRSVVRAYPATLLWPLLLFALLCGMGVWAVTRGAQSWAETAKARAQSLAKDAAVEYRQLLTMALSVTQVLSSLIEHDPHYDAVSRLFNATAPALASAVPQACVRAMQLAPSGVVRNVYPSTGNDPQLGLDLFGDPFVAIAARSAASNLDISLEGPVPADVISALSARTSAGGGSTAPTDSYGSLLVAYKAIHVRVSDPRVTWGRPTEPNPLCGPPCDYNTTSGTKFWGMAAVLVQLDALQTPLGDAMVSAPLRTLASMGYRYSLVAPASRYESLAGIPDSGGGGGGAGRGGDGAEGRSAAEVVVESSPSGPGGQALSAEVELGYGVQWSLRVGPAGSTWMPNWYGGVLAAVVVLALAASLLLFGLLVSRRRHQMLLHSLLPADLIRDLETQHDPAVLEPKSFTSESPADVLSGLLSALLSGQPADLRDVVLLRTVLRRRLDVYSPLNLGGRIKEANLDSDVARALMRQLGDSPDILATGGGIGGGPWVGDNPLSYLIGSNNNASTTAAACGKSVGGAAGYGRLRFLVPTAAASNGSCAAATATAAASGSLHELLLSTMQQREQQLMYDCRTITGALAFILSAPDDDAAAATGTAEAEMDCGGSCSSPPGSVVRRQDLVATTADLVTDDATDASASGFAQGSLSGGAGPVAVAIAAAAAAAAVSDAQAPLSHSGVFFNPLAVLPPPAAQPPPLPQLCTVGGSAAPPPPLLLHSLSLPRSRLRSGSGLNLRPGTPSLGGGGGGVVGSGAETCRRGASPLSFARSAAAASDAGAGGGADGGSDVGCSGSFAGAAPSAASSALAGAAAVLPAPAAVQRCGEAARAAATISVGMHCADEPPAGPRRDAQRPPPLSSSAGNGGGGCSGSPSPQEAASTPGGSPAGRVLERLASSIRLTAAATRGSRRRSSVGHGVGGASGGGVGVGVGGFSQYLPLSQSQIQSYRCDAAAADSIKYGAGVGGGVDGGGGLQFATSVGEAEACTAAGAIKALATVAGRGSGAGMHVSAAGSGRGGVDSNVDGDGDGGVDAMAPPLPLVSVAAAEGDAGDSVAAGLRLPGLPPGAAASAPPPPPPPPPARPLLEEVERLLSSCDVWQFDCWSLQEACGGHALSCLGFFLMRRAGLMESLSVEPVRLARLLRTLEAGYPATNPYHNSVHAADVLHTLHVLLHGAGLTAHYLDPLGLMAAYFAAIIHDYGHPGLTNDFLIASSHPLALRYNDRSPLESHHCAAAFTLLADRPELDITSGLGRQQRAAFRKLVIEMVLATDMKQHFAILNQFKTVHRLANASGGGGGGGGGGGAVSSGPPPTPPQQQQSLLRSSGNGGGGGAPAQRPSRTVSGSPAVRSAGPEARSLSRGNGDLRSNGAAAAPTTVTSAPAADGGGSECRTTGDAGAAAAGGTSGAASAPAACPAECWSWMDPVQAPVPLDEAERILSLQVMLKVADIGHLGAGLELHKRWLSVLEEEFFRQGDRERHLGLPISPLFDRAKQGVSKSQVGFFDFVALPLVRAAAEAFPGASPLLHCFQANYNHWRQIEAEATAAAAAAAAAAVAGSPAATGAASGQAGETSASGVAPTAVAAATTTVGHDNGGPRGAAFRQAPVAVRTESRIEPQVASSVVAAVATAASAGGGAAASGRGHASDGSRT